VQLVPVIARRPRLRLPEPEGLLADPAVVKLMHFARFDVAVLQHSFGITVAPVRCTKIAAKLVRTFTDRHGLKDLCKELLGVELSKQQQTSDWGAVDADRRAAAPMPPRTCCICMRCGRGWRRCWSARAARPGRPLSYSAHWSDESGAIASSVAVRTVWRHNLIQCEARYCNHSSISKD
jgi:hypothetical protein